MSIYVFVAVRKLQEVEEAKALMTEAMDWSVFTWLFQKRRVREAADAANAALDKLMKSTRARWSDDVKAAYKTLSRRDAKNSADSSPTPEIQEFIKKAKDLEDAARHARRDAEDTFADAERLLNTGLAREGCRKALHQWELDAKAIRCAEAAPAAAKQQS